MTAARFVADCRKYPSDSNCSLLISGTEEEVLATAEEHAATKHGHTRGPALREELRKLIEKEASPGAAQANLDLARALYAAFNKRDFEFIERSTDPNATMLNVATGEIFRGQKAVREYSERWAKAFPDAWVELGNTSADEGGFVAEFVGSGTHKGALETPDGELAATGRTGRLRCAEVFQVRGGKLTEGRAYFDVLTLMEQLGVGQQPGMSAGRQAESAAGAEQRH